MLVPLLEELKVRAEHVLLLVFKLARNSLQDKEDSHNNSSVLGDFYFQFVREKIQDLSITMISQLEGLTCAIDWNLVADFSKFFR